MANHTSTLRVSAPSYEKTDKKPAPLSVGLLAYHHSISWVPMEYTIKPGFLHVQMLSILASLKFGKKKK